MMCVTNIILLRFCITTSTHSCHSWLGIIMTRQQHILLTLLVPFSSCRSHYTKKQCVCITGFWRGGWGCMGRREDWGAGQGDM